MSLSNIANDGKLGMPIREFFTEGS